MIKSKKQKPTKVLTQEELVELKSEIQDLLGKALVKMQNVAPVPVDYDYDYGRVVGTRIEASEEEQDETGETYKMNDDGEYLTEESEEHIYLSGMKDVLEKVVENGTDYMLKQYYTSNC